MTEPVPGSRWLDREFNRVAIYLGDHGHGPWWRYENGAYDAWYCDWLDFYLWNRFEAIP